MNPIGILAPKARSYLTYLPTKWQISLNPIGIMLQKQAYPTHLPTKIQDSVNPIGILPPKQG